MVVTYKSLTVAIAVVMTVAAAATATIWAGGLSLSDATTPAAIEQSSGESPLIATSTPVPAGVQAVQTPTSDATGVQASSTATETPYRVFPTLTPVPPPPIEEPTEVPEAPDHAVGTAPPSTLHIPKVGVQAPVEYVGRDETGNMDVPANYWNVAWYEPGPAPGDVGNSVLAGHVDSQSGPAVFWDLRELVPGDYVYVTTSTGDELTFQVTEVSTYSVADVPLPRLFGPADERNLNLVTCEGAFDQAAREYDLRRVVYTTLVN